MIGEVTRQLIAQADKALPEETSKLAQLLEWLNQNPVLGWGMAIFALVALAVAAVAALTGNLGKIFSFYTQYLKRTQSEFPEEQLRKQLLQQMETDVASRLNDSLHNLIRVDLEQKEQRYQVGQRKAAPLVKTESKKFRPLQMIRRSLSVFRNSHDIEPVAPAEKTYAIFHRADIGRRLLILGEPGAGKTTELLTVTQRLVNAAAEDRDQPLPLIFELSSWEPDTPISTWIGQQLRKVYGVSESLADRLAQTWIEQRQILPLLDGLDELGQQNQIACIQALEDFLGQHSALPAIVCCRREEYEQGEAQLTQLNGAIYLQAVKPQQIRQYLKDLDREPLWTGIQAEPELLKLAQSPLFLTMLVIAYQDEPIRDKASLFNAYIHKQLHDPSHQGVYKPGKEKSPEQTLHYLGWLARQLNQRNETEFLIEHLQPDWLEDKHNIRTYLLINRLTAGLIAWLFFGLIFGLIAWLFFGLIGGLIAWLCVGLCVGLSIGRRFGLVDEIKSRERMNWSLRDGLRVGLRDGLIFGVIFGLVLGLTNGLIFGVSFDLRAVLMGMLIAGLTDGLASGISDEEIEQKQTPNQGIKKSFQIGLIYGLIFGLIYGLVLGLIYGLIFGLIYGLIGGLFYGLTNGLGDTFQHFILRIFLTRTGNTPWNYSLFLEHAARHRFVQRTGGRYRFIHDLLRQHFAQMTPQQQELLAKNSEKLTP